MWKTYGCSAWIARQCPDAEVAKEFVFVERPSQDAAKLAFHYKDRAEPAASVAGLARIVNEAREFRTRFKETLKALHDLRDIPEIRLRKR